MAQVLQSWQEYCGVRAASRYNVYWSREIITGYKTVREHRSSVAVQTISEPEIYHGAGVKLRADARVRVHVCKRIYVVPAEDGMKVKD